jgi:AcrR family transcriptional regulator
MPRPARATTAEPPARRLGADDWVRAALDIMVDEGIAGVKIQRLCDRLGVTKGSFYWHFADLDAFLGELARQWADDGVELEGKLELDEGDPAASLLRAMKVFAEPRSRNLARAMRDWARNDERARTAIRRADRSLYERIKGAMCRLGFDDEEAEVRAKILYYSGVGFAHVGSLGTKATAAEQLAATWELLTTPPH